MPLVLVRFTGFVFSMSATGAGLSFRNAADTEDMIFWSKLDKPAEDVPPNIVNSDR
jgi:hypothetical protein